jgi:hypothetical protein
MTVSNLIDALRKLPGNCKVSVGIVQAYRLGTPDFDKSDRHITVVSHSEDNEVVILGRKNMLAIKKNQF